MKSTWQIPFSLVSIICMTPFMTGFVLLGKSTSILPATPAAPEVEFVYDPNGEVPSLSDKSEIENGVYANTSDRELMPILITLAMSQWNSIRGSYLRLVLVPADATPQRSREDRINVILAEKNENASTAAFATPEVNPDDSSQIIDCDISISLRPVSAQSFLETVTHELGHCVGLGHPHNNYGAIMSYSRGGKSHKLGADDKAGAIYLYPDPNYVDGNPEEFIGCGNIGKHRRSSRLLAGVLLLFPLFVALRRKKALSRS
jgi:hypothetical protein